MFVLLILAIRFFSHQSKQESKTIIIDDETMNSNSKMEKNSHSFTNHSNYQNSYLLASDNFDDLEKIADRSQWNVTANSWQADNEAHSEGPPKYMVDGNPDTLWHSRHSDQEGGKGTPKKGPYHIIIDLNETVLLGGFLYGPRKGGQNGRFTNYNLYLGFSMDDVEKKIKENNPQKVEIFNIQI